MRRHVFATTLGLLLAFALSPIPRAQAAPVTEEEAHAIGVDAYLYFYPLITMDLTRLQFTNVEPGKDPLKGPMNTFVNIPAYPSADMRVVVRPNFDTLYSSAWLDLTKEPVVVSVPDTGSRYYLLPMLDMWTDVFASPGWRTTGTSAGNFLITPSDWSGTTPSEFTQIKAPTPYVWIIGRTRTNGPADYEAVHKIQAGYKITPLSRWGKEPEPVTVKIDPNVDMSTPPKKQVDTMPAGKFFAYAAELLKLHSPHITDQPIIVELRKIGFEAGKSFDLGKADPTMKKALKNVPEDAQKLMAWKVPTLARVVNYWSMNTDTMGVYGNYYLKRAIVSQLGLGANLPEDAIYPLNLSDSEGQPLDGANKYTIHFDKGATPPSMLSGRPRSMIQKVSKSQTRSIASLSQAGCDSTTIPPARSIFKRPGNDKEANWLPAPKRPFNLTMRLYALRGDSLTGKWNPPPVVKIPELPSLTVQ